MWWIFSKDMWNFVASYNDFEKQLKTKFCLLWLNFFKNLSQTNTNEFLTHHLLFFANFDWFKCKIVANITNLGNFVPWEFY